MFVCCMLRGVGTCELRGPWVPKVSAPLELVVQVDELGSRHMAGTLGAKPSWPAVKFTLNCSAIFSALR